MTMEDDAAYACASCGFTTRDAATLEAHGKSHESGDQCPLCMDRTTTLMHHLVTEHKIAESAVDRLLAVHRPPSTGPASSGYGFRCPQCSMAFRSEASLQSHSIIHLFATTHKCSACEKVCTDADELRSHMDEEHPKEDEQRCELCQETFASKTALVAHFNSVRHLHKAKQHLEKQGAVDLSAQTGLIKLLGMA
ncbi:unnamed protein product [Caenorhabditis auriculariae]|uniref:C2H2-type domain-containing protein n=1 Tax=Caenorhabditis auriculariae TaxID=2777116 RepID=A0A8S1GPG9_9PELO|nr:unnamed protein product [Caenorhabditis auriculariae]